VNQIDPEHAVKHLGTIADGAARYKCHSRSIRRMIARGDLTAYRLPGSRLLRIDLNELDAKLRQIPTAGQVA
jgi:excisionase family DNA binding protein